MQRKKKNKIIVDNFEKCKRKTINYLLKIQILFFVCGVNTLRKKKKFINSENDHLILTAAHPSPLSANRGGWFGCNHFNIINDHLISIKKKEIIW